MKLWQAFKAVSEGKRVEVKGYSREWIDFEKTNWNPRDFIEDVEFRLKPEPPKVIEFNLDCRCRNPTEAMSAAYDEWVALNRRSWKIVATEIKEGT